MKKSIFIVVDGPSASGKDSIIKQLVTDLSAMGKKVVTLEETKDPTYDREKILAAKQQGDKSVSQAIIAERKKLYQQKVVAYINTPTIVIANRGEPSTLAYQTLSGTIDMDTVWQLHRASNVLLPDLVVVTNCSAEEALRREQARGVSKEEKNKNFLSGKFTDTTNDALEKRKKIHNQYEKVKDFLEEKHIPLVYLYTDHMDIPQESKRILEYLTEHIESFLHTANKTPQHL